MTDFKQKFSLEQRKAEVLRIRAKYPTRLPVLCERLGGNLPPLDKKKYLVPSELTVGQFIYVIRRRMTLPPEKALYIFIDNMLPCGSSSMGSIYEKHKHADGFLYIRCSGENTFGFLSPKYI
jgi:GABA(A) receptor-associated protein